MSKNQCPKQVNVLHRVQKHVYLAVCCFLMMLAIDHWDSIKGKTALLLVPFSGVKASTKLVRRQ